MGQWKQRLSTTITAELLSWSLNGAGIKGTIANSVDRTYKNGDKFIIMGFSMQHFPRAEGHWPDHWVISTNTGQHFLLESSEQVKNGAPLA